MMKKNGFTLAEVLITLAIIGVVAVLTLPALLTNTGEQQAITAFKKGINTLTEAGAMHSAIAGFNYGSIANSSLATDTEDTQSLVGLLKSRTSYDLENSGLADQNHKLASMVSKNSANFVVFFRDGAALMFNPTQATRDGSSGYGDDTKPNNTLMADGLVYGIAAVYDTNGSKGPNLLSNCSGLTTLVANQGVKEGDKQKTPDGADTGADFRTACIKGQRVIQDQFSIRLRGSQAFPNGAASRWAFNN